MAEEAQRDESLTKRPSNQNMMLVIIIAVLGTLLLAGGIGAVLMMRGGSEKTAEAAEEASESGSPSEPSKAKEKEGGKEKVKKGDKGPAIYVELDPPFVVNFESTERARFLQVSVQLMTREDSTAQLLKDNLPIIRNDLLFLFSSQTYETAATSGGKEDLRKKSLDTVRNMIKQEGGKPDALEAIYFTSFVMQ